jgi:FdhD protein
MTACPTDLEDFAVGFSLTEGLIPTLVAVSRVTIVRYDSGIKPQRRPPRWPVTRAAADYHVDSGACGATQGVTIYAHPEHVRA